MQMRGPPLALPSIDSRPPQGYLSRSSHCIGSVRGDAMRREIAVGVFLLLSAFASHSPAQVEAPPPSDRLADAPAPSPPPPWHPWSGELLLGFPTGVRLQRDLCRDGAWQAEGFVGFDLIFPMVGGGIRHRFTPCRGENDTL